MRLHAWSTVWRDIEFDPRTGSASIVKLPAPWPNTSVPTGFAHFERGLLGPDRCSHSSRAATRVFFGAGARHWQVDQAGLRFVHSRPFPFLSRFRVLESGRVVFSILYSHVGRLLFEIVDPTYDKLDEESASLR